MTARIVVTGNAATAPDHKLTSTGRPRAVFRIGSTERRLDRATGTWVDGDHFFIGVTCWGALADNVHASVKLGTPLVVSGRIAQRTYQDKNDQVQFTYEITADSVAPDLSRGTAVFTRASRVNGPSLTLDGSGLPAMGVTENHPDDRVATGRAAEDGAHTVMGDGSFRAPSGRVLSAPHEPAPGSERDRYDSDPYGPDDADGSDESDGSDGSGESGATVPSLVGAG